MNKNFLILLLVLVNISSFGQFKLTKLTSSTWPENMKCEGNMIYAVRWTDNLGTNYVITSETGRVYSKVAGEEDLFDSYLYAYHYIIVGDSAKLTWKVYDYNKGCGLDINFYFVDSSFAVTDLDKNGRAEVWLMYKNSCHGDVSPVTTKIIMYEADKKYALRGESRVKVSETDYAGGDYTLDSNFKTGPPAFKQYAEKLWNKHKEETWER